MNIKRVLTNIGRILPVLLLIIWSAQVQAFEAKVIGVLDGDTIEVLKDRKPLRIRLYGIDTPEYDQDFGSRAKKFTSEKVFRKNVKIETIDIDRYGRTVAKVYIDGKCLNLMIVEAGLAWWYQQHAPEEKDLRLAEKEARAAKRGLWSHRKPVAPWEFRRNKSH